MGWPVNWLIIGSYPDLLWWRHQVETFSALLAICAGNSPVPGEFPTQRPATRSFDVFFDLRLNKRLSKQSRGWWFETLSHPLWRHCNATWQAPSHGLYQYWFCFYWIHTNKWWWNQKKIQAVSLQWRHLCVVSFQITGHSTVCSAKNQTTNKNIKASNYWHGNPPVSSWFPSQTAGNAENLSMSWQHHV